MHNCGRNRYIANHCLEKDVKGRRSTSSEGFKKNPQKNKDNHFLGMGGGDESCVFGDEYIRVMARIVSSIYPEGASSWVVDPGCTSHIKFHRSLFVTYESVSGKELEQVPKTQQKKQDVGKF